MERHARVFFSVLLYIISSPNYNSVGSPVITVIWLSAYLVKLLRTALIMNVWGYKHSAATRLEISGTVKHTTKLI